MLRFTFSSPAILPCLVLACSLPCQAQHLELVVEPGVGTLDQAFTITLTNLGTEDFLYDDCCSFPLITSIANAQRLPICIDCACPDQPHLGVLRPGGSIEHLWRAGDAACISGWPLQPGLYEARWTGFPEDVVARFELLPAPARRLPLRAEPDSVRFGERVRLTLENSSGMTLFDPCCGVPQVLDPLGQALCECPECFVPVELRPGETLSFDWTPAGRDCAVREARPGRHRIVWGGFSSPGPGQPQAFFGEASVLVLPPLDRRLELTLSKRQIRRDDLLEITATNPLDVSVWYDLCCHQPTLLDELGEEDGCFACPPCPFSRTGELLPGGSLSFGLTVRQCGLTPGPWSVTVGDGFALVPGVEAAPPVFGYAEVMVLPDVERDFRRGDCDGEGRINLTDPIALLGHLFLGNGAPPCPDACDANDSGRLDLTDATWLLGYLFLGGDPPAPPFPGPGPDPTTDALGCDG